MNITENSTKYIGVTSTMSKYIKNKNAPQIFKRKDILFVAGRNNNIHLFTNFLELSGSLFSNNGNVGYLCSLASTLLVSVTFRKNILIWDLVKKIIIANISVQIWNIPVCCFREEKLLVIASTTNTTTLIISTFLIENMKKISHDILLGHKTQISTIINISNKQIITGEWEGDLRLWDINEGICIQLFKTYRRLIQIKFLSQTLTCLSCKGMLTIWDMVNYDEPLKAFKMNAYQNYWGSEFLSKNVLASGKLTGVLNLLDLVTGNCFCRINLHMNAIKAIIKIGHNILGIIDNNTLKIVDPMARKYYYVLKDKHILFTFITMLY